MLLGGVKPVGYREPEVVLSGTANAYNMAEPASNDGKVTATVASSEPWTTRAVVLRPDDPRRFNGTVIVEWLNVSGGADAGADWMLGHTELIREGFAWVGVSAQKVGVDALKSDPAPPRTERSHTRSSRNRKAARRCVAGRP
jgi:Alpha/beta hydrolase domain